jgi:hypothetical protein
MQLWNNKQAIQGGIYSAEYATLQHNYWNSPEGQYYMYMQNPGLYMNMNSPNCYPSPNIWCQTHDYHSNYFGNYWGGASAPPIPPSPFGLSQ